MPTQAHSRKLLRDMLLMLLLPPHYIYASQYAVAAIAGAFVGEYAHVSTAVLVNTAISSLLIALTHLIIHYCRLASISR